MIEYPATELPLPQADYTSKPVTNTVTTTFMSGRIRRRRLGIAKYRTAKIMWQLSPEEYDFFMGWWEHVLRLGTEQFAITMATGSMLGPHIILLADEPEESLSGHFWRVSCNAVIYFKPELEASDVSGLQYAGLGLTGFLSYEDRLDYVVNSQLPILL